MLEVDVHTYYGNIKAQRISLAGREGRDSNVSSNGAGKTTTLHYPRAVATLRAKSI